MATLNKARSRADSYNDPGIKCTTEEGMTKQSFKDECDLNIILKKYQSTGQLPDMIKQNPQYGDFSALPDYQEAVAIVQMAETQFNSLNAHIRAKFQNDPAQFLAFATDSSNLPEMVKMGLAVEIPVVTTQETPVSKEDPK